MSWSTPERRVVFAGPPGWSRLPNVTRALLVLAGTLVATLFAGIAFRLPESWWVPAVGALAALALVFRLANWKCPTCGERLGGRTRPSHCPGCGGPLD